METFRDLEKRYDGSHVHLEGTDNLASGTLTLDRRKTIVSFSSAKRTEYAADRNGWFDLRLRGINGTAILLKNALYLGSTTYGGKSSRIEQRIFPNTIVFNADKMAKDDKIHSMSFRLDRLEYFFWYGYIESHSLYEASRSNLAALRRLRRARRRSYDFAKPLELHLVHAPRKILGFKVDENTYEISSGVSVQEGGGNKLTLKAELAATIRFSRPVSVDEAIKNVWSWKRFFSQIAMEPLSLDGISCRASRKTYPEAAIYLPNELREKSRKSDRFHPGDPPYNRWKDRKALAGVMSTWLQRTNSRRHFRSSVERVIKNIRRRNILEDL